jgi:hypothetical protein
MRGYAIPEVCVKRGSTVLIEGLANGLCDPVENSKPLLEILRLNRALLSAIVSVNHPTGAPRRFLLLARRLPQKPGPVGMFFPSRRPA